MITVIAIDTETGDELEQTTIVDDYAIICAGTAHVTSIQVHPNGTHVITVQHPRRRT